MGGKGGRYGGTGLKIQHGPCYYLLRWGTETGVSLDCEKLDRALAYSVIVASPYSVLRMRSSEQLNNLYSQISFPRRTTRTYGAPKRKGATMYDRQERLDHLVWDKNDDDWEQSLDLMRLQSTCRRVENLAGQHFGTPATLVLPLVLGGFNMLYRIRLEGASTDVMVRRPGTSLVPFPEEKTKQEAATANYIAENTEIPVPRHLFCGHDPLLGAFVIMQRVEHRQSMSDRLTTPNDGRSVTHRLDPNVPDATLEDLWTQTARCLVQLAHLTFPRIGALVEENGSYDVAGRPITHNMTDMIRLANVPRAVLPREGTTYQTADEWYTALAEMHLAQLLFQHNDVVSSADDCRNKWVARQIFRRLAKQGRLSVFGFAEDDWSAQSSSRAMASARLSPAPAGSGAFRLWGDDLRTGNILLSDSGKIAAMVDWEFAYAAPTQFILDPPWWLLLDRAETWPTGMDN